MNKIKWCLTVLFVASFAAMLYAADDAQAFWPAWRGPDATGVAPNGNPPTTWSETQNIKWKVKLTDDGSDSSPIVWKDKIFFQTAVKTDIVVKPAAAQPAPEQTPPPNRRPGQMPPPPAAPEMAPPPGQPAQMPPPPPAGQNPPPAAPRRGRMDIKPPTNIYQFNVVCMDRNTGDIL
jgi:outer membrane protein assembly factor BamB